MPPQFIAAVARSQSLSGSGLHADGVSYLRGLNGSFHRTASSLSEQMRKPADHLARSDTDFDTVTSVPTFKPRPQEETAATGAGPVAADVSSSMPPSTPFASTDPATTIEGMLEIPSLNTSFNLTQLSSEGLGAFFDKLLNPCGTVVGGGQGLGGIDSGAVGNLPDGLLLSDISLGTAIALAESVPCQGTDSARGLLQPTAAAIDPPTAKKATGKGDMVSEPLSQAAAASNELVHQGHSCDHGDNGDDVNDVSHAKSKLPLANCQQMDRVWGVESTDTTHYQQQLALHKANGATKHQGKPLVDHDPTCDHPPQHVFSAAAVARARGPHMHPVTHLCASQGNRKRRHRGDSMQQQEEVVGSGEELPAPSMMNQPEAADEDAEKSKLVFPLLTGQHCLNTPTGLLLIGVLQTCDGVTAEARQKLITLVKLLAERHVEATDLVGFGSYVQTVTAAAATSEHGQQHDDAGNLARAMCAQDDAEQLLPDEQDAQGTPRSSSCRSKSTSLVKTEVADQPLMRQEVVRCGCSMRHGTQASNCMLLLLLCIGTGCCHLQQQQ